MVDVDSFLTTLTLWSMTFARSLCPPSHTQVPRPPSAGVRWDLGPVRAVARLWQ